MEYKTVIKLDLTNCKYLGEMHERIRIAFDWPEWYGQNWDAFYDLLRSDCPAEKIIILGLSSMPKALSDQIEIMKEALTDEQNNRMRYGEKLDIIFIDKSDTDIEQYKY